MKFLIFMIKSWARQAYLLFVLKTEKENMLAEPFDELVFYFSNFPLKVSRLITGKIVSPGSSSGQ